MRSDSKAIANEIFAAINEKYQGQGDDFYVSLADLESIVRETIGDVKNTTIIGDTLTIELLDGRKLKICAVTH